MRTILIYLTVFSCFSIPSYGADLKGKVCITDGDTLRVNSFRKGRHCVGGTKVRLLGIDAPELKQTCMHSNGREFLCGRKSASYLFELTANKIIICKGDTTDRYKRVLGTCFADSVNLNRRMVQQGWAVAYRAYSKKYIQAEENARKANRGIWMMKFDMPWIWRKKSRRR
jgi:endonuclease YncB( thermonuclease family)